MRRGDDTGTMAIEVVLLVPVLVMLMVLVVAFGRYVNAEGDVQAVARESVRAATLERDEASARAAAQAAATAMVPDTVTCDPVVVTGDFVPGGRVTVDLTCQVSWENLGLIGLSGSGAVNATSTAPFDLYRRMG